MRLFLARHAAVPDAGGLCYGRLDLAADPSLGGAAALAVHRATPLGARLRCSPALRCRQLANALVQLRPGLAIELDPALQELDFGAWEGRAWHSIGESAVAAWTRDFASHRPGGGESVQMLLARVDLALERDRRAGQDVLWITHAGVVRAVRLLLQGVREVPEAAQWPSASVPFGMVESHPL